MNDSAKCMQTNYAVGEDTGHKREGHSLNWLRIGGYLPKRPTPVDLLQINLNFL